MGWGGQAAPPAVISVHVYLDSKEGSRLVLYFKMCREGAWSGSFSVCFSPPAPSSPTWEKQHLQWVLEGGLGRGWVPSPGLSMRISVFSHVIDSVAVHPGDAHFSLSVPVKIFMCLLSSSGL